MGTLQNIPPDRTQVPADELLSYTDLAHRLDELSASPRIMVSVAGKSAQGRDIHLVTITSEENMRRIEALRASAVEVMTYRRTRPTLSSAPSAAAPVSNLAGLVPSVLLTGLSFGHEAAHVEGLVQLIENLDSSSEPAVRSILSKLVVLVFPMINPDGRMLSIEEWRRYPLSTGCNGAGDALGFLLNRDFLHLIHPETQAVLKTYGEWEPIACIDLHEDKVMLGVSRPEVCWVPPYRDKPYSPDLPRDIMSLVDELGSVIAGEWESRGYRVMFDRSGKDALLPLTGIGGRADLTFIFHNSVALLTESARTPGSQSWNDRVDQKCSATKAALGHVAMNLPRYLSAVIQAKTVPPEHSPSPVYVVKQADSDPAGLHQLVSILRRHSVEFYETDSPCAAFIVPTDQPKGYMLRTLFRDQKRDRQVLLPDLGCAALTLAKLPEKEREAFAKAHLRMTNGSDVPQIMYGEGVSSRSTDAIAFGDSGWGVALANRLMKAGHNVFRLPELYEQEVVSLPAGAFFVADVEPRQLHDLGAGLGGELVAVDRRALERAQEIHIPRVGLYAGQGVDTQHCVHKAHLAWALQQMAFPFSELLETDFDDDALSRFDVLIVPAGDAAEIVDGRDPTGIWNSSPWEAAGERRGIGEPGLEAISAFVRSGGGYIGVGAGGGALISESFAGLMDVRLLEPIANKGEMLLKMERPDHPLLLGYGGCFADTGERLADTFVASYYGERLFGTPASPMLEVGPAVDVIATYHQLIPAAEFRPDPDVDVSFYRGKPAIVCEHIGKGKATLFGVNPGFRGIWTSTFRLVANALYWSRGS
jgi:hypothetical protein